MVWNSSDDQEAKPTLQLGQTKKMKASKNAKKTIQKTSVRSTDRKALKPPSAHDQKAFGFFEKRVTKGEETIGKKKIPFHRVEKGGGWVETTYGCSEIYKLSARPEVLTCLVKTVRPGHIEWKTLSTNRVLSHGPASNILQGNMAATRIFYNIIKAREMAPPYIEPKLEKSELEITITPNPFDFLSDLIANDIRSGSTKNLSDIAKCIEAVVQQEEKSKTDKILAALKSLAEHFNRIPTKSEVLEEFNNISEDASSDEGNFMRALASAGLAWLPTKHSKTHKGP